MSKQKLASIEAWFNRATDLLAESLDAWEGEEDSVKEEKEDHIAELNKFFHDLAKAHKAVDFEVAAEIERLQDEVEYWKSKAR